MLCGSVTASVPFHHTTSLPIAGPLKTGHRQGTQGLWFPIWDFRGQRGEVTEASGPSGAAWEETVGRWVVGPPEAEDPGPPLLTRVGEMLSL